MTLKMFHHLFVPQPGHPSDEDLGVYVKVTADAEYVQRLNSMFFYITIL